jgi:hypothetical protein
MGYHAVPCRYMEGKLFERVKPPKRNSSIGADDEGDPEDPSYVTTKLIQRKSSDRPLSFMLGRKVRL